LTSRLTEVIVDCHDLDAVATFWCAVLGYERANSGEGWLAIGPSTTDASPDVAEDELRAAAQPPAIAFVLVPEGKAVKNRLHLDVTPIDRSQQDEVLRLVALGARHTDIGQRATRWVVMIDPEGNEFCVMPAPGDQPNSRLTEPFG
jgi:catechol 2,3-dioxygenase-like lactoylglutathione lyase family enzyme